MVAPEEGDSVFVPDLECEQHEEGLDAVPSAVDVVPEEDVVGVGGVSSNFEEFEEVVELPVDVSADGDWRAHAHCIGLVLEYLLGQFAELLDGGLLYLLPFLDLLDDLLC